jgi:hypothetical protein
LGAAAATSAGPLKAAAGPTPSVTVARPDPATVAGP